MSLLMKALGIKERSTSNTISIDEHLARIEQHMKSKKQTPQVREIPTYVPQIKTISRPAIHQALGIGDKVGRALTIGAIVLSSVLYTGCESSSNDNSYTNDVDQIEQTITGDTTYTTTTTSTTTTTLPEGGGHGL